MTTRELALADTNLSGFLETTLGISLPEADTELKRRCVVSAGCKVIDFSIESGVLVSVADDLEVTTTFNHGTATRAMGIPKGVVVTGRVHKLAHMTFVTKGRLAIYSSQLGYKVYAAGESFWSEAGVKRLILALEDSSMANTYITACTDEESLREVVTAPNFTEAGFGTSSDELPTNLITYLRSN